VLITVTVTVTTMPCSRCSTFQVLFQSSQTTTALKGRGNLGLHYERLFGELQSGFFCEFNFSLLASLTIISTQTQQFQMYSTVKLLEICKCARMRMQSL